VDSIIVALRRSVAGDSMNKGAWRDLSRRLVEKGDTVGAVDAALHQLKADPTDGVLRAQVAGALISQGKFVEAAELLDEGLATNPADLALLVLKERAAEGAVLRPGPWQDALRSIPPWLRTAAIHQRSRRRETGDTTAMLRWSQRGGEVPRVGAVWRAPPPRSNRQ
jgi:hypothetical protein